jgi:predicted nucleic acid-binding protein
MYVLDTNVFVQAHRRHYGLDFVPGFWDWLDANAGTGVIASVRAVLDELTGEDALAAWAKQRKDMFRAADPRTQLALRDVAVWATRNYEREFVDEFLGNADCHLVAFAKAYGCVLVTHEQPEDPKKKRKSVTIPDACNEFGVNWADPFKMLRDEQARLVLGA